MLLVIFLTLSASPFHLLSCLAVFTLAEKRQAADKFVAVHFQSIRFKLSGTASTTLAYRLCQRGAKL